VNKNFADEASKALPDKDAHVVVSCQKGRRGAFATKLLKDRGFGKIFNLGGGMNEWAAAGLPTQM
jgi:rhodanese-related sulfurtransferase